MPYLYIAHNNLICKYGGSVRVKQVRVPSQDNLINPHLSQIHKKGKCATHKGTLKNTKTVNVICKVKCKVIFGNMLPCRSCTAAMLRRVIAMDGWSALHTFLVMSKPSLYTTHMYNVIRRQCYVNIVREYVAKNTKAGEEQILKKITAPYNFACKKKTRWIRVHCTKIVMQKNTNAYTVQNIR